MSNKSLLESALIEAQQIEETVKSNAKEILASTMKEEIEELVKESLSNNGLRKQKVIKEQELEAMVDDDEEVIDIDDEGGDDEMDDVLAMADEVDVDDIPSPEGEEEFEPLDLTQASDEDVLKVFKAMGAEDGVIVKQDDDVISIEDEGTGEEYRIEFNESKKRKSTIKEDEGSEEEVDIDVEDEVELDERWGSKMGEDPRHEVDGVEKERKDYMEEDDDSMYEISLDDEISPDDVHESGPGEGGKAGEGEGEGGKSGEGEDLDLEEDARTDAEEEGYKDGMKDAEEDMEEMWRGNNLGQKVHAGNRTNKFNKSARDKAGINMKESKRSIRNRFINERKRMDKTKVLTETIDNLKGEVNVLKNKNGEYKKALIMFRDKLNEVAVFNSNLAYATKLFTEHTTNKSEKINILRRFDTVESLKESKALYKNVKRQLSSSTKSVVKESLGNKNSKKTVQLSESVQRKITKTPTAGSSNLIESRTYVDPQIARSLDIMSKIK